MDARQMRQRLLQRGEALVLAEVAQEAQDQPRADAPPRLGLGAGALQAVEHGLEGDAARGVGLRVEEQLGMDDIVVVRALEVGDGEIEEVLLVDQRRRAGVIQVEKALQVGEGVGGARGLHAVPRQRHAVTAREREHHLRLERALDVQVQLGLGQGADEGFEVHGNLLADGGILASKPAFGAPGRAPIGAVLSCGDH